MSLITRDAEESVNFLRRYLFLQAFPCRALYCGDNRVVILFPALAGELAYLLGEQRVFHRISGAQHICSNCRAKYYRQQEAEERSQDRVCENCGKTFIATRRDKKYCCEDCQADAKRQMQKKRNAEKRKKAAWSETPESISQADKKQKTA